MSVVKSGDLVVLKSGGPVMTVDTVNTDILDDDKITGVLCVWFVGEKLERVRFDPNAIEPAPLHRAATGKKGAGPEEATGEYKVVLDDMVAAMNDAADAEKDAAKVAAKGAAKATLKASANRPKPAPAPKPDVAAAPAANGVSAVR